MPFSIVFILLFFLAGALASPSKPCHDGLVDLGYAKHVPTSVNTTSSGRHVSIYKNIRFANPPTGPLRFRHPSTTIPAVDEVQDGNYPWRSLDCVSSAPGYIPFPEFNGTTWGREDCLFLDVYVPEGVRPGDDVPVLHYFFGSAYAFGSKELLFNPMGLFEQMFSEGKEKFIFVSNNYRMGALGFTYADGEDLDGNVGLFDCLAAAKWTAKFIDRFGGDGKRITASGQSAGAGMLFYMTTLFGGKGQLPFQQVYMSSPAAPPRRNVTERQKQLFNLVLESANCTSLECLRDIPEEAMIDVNGHLINNMESTGGGGVLGPIIGFGPAPDGKTIPDLPLSQFQHGAYYHSLERLLVSNMANEGMGLSHDTDMPAYFPIMVRQILPSASNGTVAAIQAIYYDAAEPERLAWDWTTDVIFACNAHNLAEALPDTARRYIMSIEPGYHGQDILYFFYVDQETTPVEDVAMAREFQSKILRFVRGEELDEWPVVGEEMKLLNITGEGFEETTLRDDMKARCEVINRFVLDGA